MTAESSVELITSLVDLAESFDAFNIAVRREADERSGQDVLSNAEVHVLALINGSGDLTTRLIEESTGYGATLVMRTLRSLQKRGLVDPVKEDAGLVVFRATPAGNNLRTMARDRCAQHMQYAMTGMSMEDRAALAQARSALAGLGAALGYMGLHASYDSESSGDAAPTDNPQ